jgi:hypothetical protein
MGIVANLPPDLWMLGQPVIIRVGIYRRLLFPDSGVSAGVETMLTLYRSIIYIGAPTPAISVRLAATDSYCDSPAGRLTQA